jgi:hypothetical protein
VRPQQVRAQLAAKRRAVRLGDAAHEHSEPRRLARIRHVHAEHRRKGRAPRSLPRACVAQSVDTHKHTTTRAMRQSICLFFTAASSKADRSGGRAADDDGATCFLVRPGTCTWAARAHDLGGESL